jgi:Family of unknown function (DUF6011)
MAGAYETVQARLWASVIIAPVPTLVALRDTVLAIRPDRCPKWRFRLAEEVVLQLQPQPEQRHHDEYLLVGTVIQGPGITRAHFATKRAARGQAFTVIGFGLKDGACPDFTWKHGRSVTNAPCPGQWRMRLTGATGAAEPLATLKELLVASFPRLSRLTPDLMFQANCLLCGKSLTDPVSMARWIGPECAHTHSLDVGLVHLNDHGDGQPQEAYGPPHDPETRG